MSQNNVILLLGTNLGNKNKNLALAKSFISKDIGNIIKESNILENEAVGFTTNNLFLNQKIEVITNLSPFDLLKNIKKIEKKMGRKYTKPLINELYVDRLIDIDILHFNSLTIDCDTLKIPHNQIYTRGFIKNLSFY